MGAVFVSNEELTDRLTGYRCASTMNWAAIPAEKRGGGMGSVTLGASVVAPIY